MQLMRNEDGLAGSFVWTGRHIMRLSTRAALLSLLPLVTAGCSFIFVNGPPPGHQELAYFTCTDTKGL